MKKIVLGGLLGGLVMFFWGFVVHAVLNVGVDEIQKLGPEREAAAMAALRENLGDSGLYYLPWIDMRDEHDDAELEAYGKRHESGPVAFIVYTRDGAPVMPPSMLIEEFLSNLLAALIVACMAGMMAGGYLKRAFAVAGFGAVGWLSISASNTIWFRFPVGTFLGEGFEQIVGWLLVGFVVARVVPAAARGN
ncbi:MAG: hypothetical protein H6807_17470 [Planctomycetes bacterium]|nr:hypothetical protein [Planctomycetota bacterium]